MALRSLDLATAESRVAQAQTSYSSYSDCEPIEEEKKEGGGNGIYSDGPTDSVDGKRADNTKENYGPGFFKKASPAKQLTMTAGEKRNKFDADDSENVIYDEEDFWWDSEFTPQQVHQPTLAPAQKSTSLPSVVPKFEGRLSRRPEEENAIDFGGPDECGA
mmetsp:Transcript_24174/g.37169  ORF Transcript_24174/g.37169 Transcript_24174/m.37169 type:complete len:161 (+) Transcript_24174:6353-6835(+)|eukprot:CAMPEP_0170494990 /NCGR_PEP_ID=MMETSP0208-20121228/14952_1 /TAXON_ID=197538 /ORGANISM="Strombidium inclinatum, Strain S3" /LENGTH=160 /DNA_ID=CAMNT_0010771119 /DNA_START=6338 /DNA_END=6820 /DNA_ORIENTATION=+